MTMLTRRSLIRTGAAATAATLVGLRPWTAAPAAAAGATASAEYLRRSTYGGLAGQRFTVGPLALELLSVSDLAGGTARRKLAGSEDAFALAFAGPLDAPLDGGIQTFSHPELGSFDLFVSPVDRPGRDRRYEVIVDRSVGAPQSPPRPPKATTGSAAAAPAAAAIAPAAAAPAAARLFRRVSLRRTAHGARAELVLRPSMGIARVHGRLIHRGHTLAVASHHVHDDRTVLRFGSAQRLPAGAYTLLLTTTGVDGVRTSRRRRVTLG
jgi:hypothetical protein